MTNDSQNNDSPKNPPRLCSEIQLFDLCTKETCSHRSGRYCTDGDILARFEAISEEDDTALLMEDPDDMEESDDLECDDDAVDDDYDSDESEEGY